MGPPGGDSSSAWQESRCLDSSLMTVDGCWVTPQAAFLRKIEACCLVAEDGNFLRVTGI